MLHIEISALYQETLRGVFLHSFLELSSYTIIGAGVRAEGVGSIDEPDSSAWLSVWGVSVCRFGFSTLPASKRSKFHTVTVLGNTYIRKLWRKRDRDGRCANCSVPAVRR